MTSREFLACLLALTVIKPHDVPNFEGPRWLAFQANRLSFLLNAGQIEEAEIWHAIESLAARQDNSEATEEEKWR